MTVEQKRRILGIEVGNQRPLKPGEKILLKTEKYPKIPDGTDVVLCPSDILTGDRRRATYLVARAAGATVITQIEEEHTYPGLQLGSDGFFWRRAEQMEGPRTRTTHIKSGEIKKGTIFQRIYKVKS